ncbi:MAG: hypothetical protein QG597_5029 [Actinomycetota bacterium]|nr:hypothetical protein [Actinomycetota bacterium]
MRVPGLIPLCDALKGSSAAAVSSQDAGVSASLALSVLIAPSPVEHQMLGLVNNAEPLLPRDVAAWLALGSATLWAQQKGLRGGALQGAPVTGNGIGAPPLGNRVAVGRASFLRWELPDANGARRRGGADPFHGRPPLRFVSFFARLKDPRVKRRKRHKLVDIVVIGLCAVLCGAEGWEDMEEFGHSRKGWLRAVLGLELPNGIPGHDTMRRVFGRLDPSELGECIADWLRTLRRRGLEDVIALDGKTVRHSYDALTGQSAIHLVSAWATENGLALGQVKVDGKSNEITALPQLLKALDVSGCTVTIDAMGCQREIARQIREQQGHYVLALKGNQEGLHESVKLLFDDALAHGFYAKDPNRRIEHDHYRSIEKDHGRIETRNCWVISGRHVAELTQAGKWSGLKSVVLVQSERKVGEKVSTERRYFITSHEGKAGKIARAVREHWRVENGLHYVLDVAMGEDACGIWKDNGPENLATLRRAAISLLRQERSSRRGVKARMKRAAWDTDYLIQVLLS